MKKLDDQDVFGIAFGSCDQRTAAFRQKMFRHFQTSDHQHWITIEKKTERKKYVSAILHKKIA